MAYTLPKLKYEYDALEPVFDKETMEIHHTKHHQAYIDKLNAAVNQDDPIALKKLLLTNASDAVQNHGGGHFNHSFFWKILAPKGKGGKRSDALNSAINEACGSYDEFVKTFTNAAMTRFGSGWAWACVNKATGKIEVFSQPNQNHPKLNTHIPLIGLDVWEHAYYLKYQNRRPKYIKAFFEIVNWNHVNKLYSDALSSSENGHS